MQSDHNPILNNPYEEPKKHYYTNADGTLNYNQKEHGRRKFAVDRSSLPRKEKSQKQLYSQEALVDETHLINLTRAEVKKWREEGYPNTTRVTKELLEHWFPISEGQDMTSYQRVGTKQLFFAQREAIETAIYLNEIAYRNNAGSNILRIIKEANKVSENQDKYNLPRIAFKMATGTGKSTVMALLITYHLLNRKQYHNDTRFADYFIVITPNITIKDRLQEIATFAKDRKNTYEERSLIPEKYKDIAQDLSSKVFITNYHTFMLKNLDGNLVGVTDNRTDYFGNKNVVKKSYNTLFKDELPKSFKFDRRLIVLNDEAHHCYLPLAKGSGAQDSDFTNDEKERASIWINAIAELSQRFKLQNVYDLSATPYYLLGSGYNEGQLFGWVASDFSLVEAIESGLVKIPYLPDLDVESQKETNLNNIYQVVKDKLPKKNQHDQLNENPFFPAEVKDALQMFYTHYEKGYDEFRSLFSTNPVMIIVCANTAISKEMYRHVAGWEKTAPDGSKHLASGVFDKFSNIDENLQRYKTKPSTLLIDSKALEDASSVIDTDFKKTFLHELEAFEIEYAKQYGSGKKPTESEILREVMNTVGKQGKLGGYIHCVISVSMLTEGWDANTVTHIFGLRAFGSQLLCEQVIGRALRRKNYYLGKYDKDTNELLPANTRKTTYKEKYPPEYAYIVGIPFEFVGKGKRKPVVAPRPEVTQIFAIKEREKELAISFPQVEAYQAEGLKDIIEVDYDAAPDFIINEDFRPTEAHLTSAIEARTEKIDLEGLKSLREQEIIFKITAYLIDRYYRNYGETRFYKFQNIFEIVRTWYNTKLQLRGKKAFKQMVYHDLERATEHIHRIINISQMDSESLKPVLNTYNPFNSTIGLQGITNKPVFPTKKSHVNYVVADTMFWEQQASEALEGMIEVQRYVKNAFLDFKIPYINDAGLPKNYLPDFLTQVITPKRETVNLIVEVTGSNTDNKDLKAEYAQNFWCKSVNNVRHTFKENPHRWDYVEIKNIEAFEGLLRYKINLL